MAAVETVLQVALPILTLAIFFVIHKLSKTALTKLRTTNRATLQATPHFVLGSQLLTRARSTPHKAQSHSHAKSALTEAEIALSHSPQDPGPHILRALALDLLGHKASALRLLDAALRQVTRGEGAWGGAGEAGGAEARAEQAETGRLGGGGPGGGGGLSSGEDNTTAFCLLGQCYEWKGMREEAKEAFDRALKIDSGSVLARQGLDRLRLIKAQAHEIRPR